MNVKFEHHPGFYVEELDYFNFYGLMFNNILEAAEFLKRLPYDPNMYLTGLYHKRGYKFLVDNDTGMVWTGRGWLPDDSFINDFIRKIKHSHKSDVTDAN